jgi:hypothetical protein
MCQLKLTQRMMVNILYHFIIYLFQGIFVQFIMGSAIFVFGVVMNVVELTPPFYPLAMAGGALFACGNHLNLPSYNVLLLL